MMTMTMTMMVMMMRMMMKMMMMMMTMMMMMRRPSSLRVRAKPRHLPYIYIWAHPSSEKSSKVVFEHSNVPPVHTSKQKISVQEYIFSPDWPVANLLKSHGFLRQPQG